MCQKFAQEKWRSEQLKNALNVHTFHVVFTVPAELNALFLNNKTDMYNLLFDTSSQTVLCADRKYLGAVLGITAVLHSWGSSLSFHPHIHMSVTGGGLADNRFWRNGRKKSFIPVKVLASVFRDKFMESVQKLFPNLDPELADACWAKDWVSYCKPSVKLNGEIDYFARYSQRVAISNDRITGFDGSVVTIRYKDYRNGGKNRLMSLSATEFIRRYMMHILPRAICVNSFVSPSRLQTGVIR